MLKTRRVIIYYSVKYFIRRAPNLHRWGRALFRSIHIGERTDSNACARVPVERAKMVGFGEGGAPPRLFVIFFIDN